MNERVRMVLVLVAALVAALTTYRFLAGQREVETVVIAAVEIPAGTRIESSMLSTVTVGKREQNLLAPLAVRDSSQVLGRAPKQLIRKGAVLALNPDDLYLSDEALKEATGGVVPPAYLIPHGFVAIAVPVIADSAVGFTLQKGDRVNVIYTGKNGLEVISKTIMVNVQILDVGRSDGSGIGGGSGNLKTVTLLVTPEDAEKVALAKHSGKIDLALAGK